MKYYDAKGQGGDGLSRMAFSLTWDWGCEYESLHCRNAQTGVAWKSRGANLFAKGITASAFMNYLCLFYDFPIPFCVASMLQI